MKLGFDENREFIPCPEGTHRATCVDVVDLGQVETQWGDKHKLRIVWEVDKLMDPDENGERRNFIFTNRYTASLNERSNLYADLVAWRGRDFSDEEQAEGFELEDLIGAHCLISIVHKAGTYQNKPTIFANLTKIQPLPKFDPETGEPMSKFEPSGSYVRVKDRDDSKTGAAPNVNQYGAASSEATDYESGESFPPEDDDIPF